MDDFIDWFQPYAQTEPDDGSFRCRNELLGGLEPDVEKVCFCSDPPPVEVIDYSEPNWYNFIISKDIYNSDLDASWGVIESYKSDYSEFIFRTSDKKMCMLTKDINWPNLEWKDNLVGFRISEEESPCPYIEENGWNYAVFTKDKGTATSLSNADTIVGIFGNDWKFKSTEDFQANHDQYWG